MLTAEHTHSSLLKAQAHSTVSAIALMVSPSPFPLVMTQVEDLSTHAGRNPTQAQQETRVLSRPSLSLAQKATRALRHIADHEKAEEMTTALETLLTRHREELEIFSKEHNTKLDHIQKLTSQSSHYKQKRAVTIQNAKVHAKSLEVNEGTYTIHHYMD